MASPYAGKPPHEWLRITQELVARHPLLLSEIREIALESWDELWQTRVGEGSSAIALATIDVPATVVGYFFEKLFARKLSGRHPAVWRGQAAKDEKDLVCILNREFDTEVKSSGQLGTRIYGNRSYGKQAAEPGLVSKIEKSGYYITVNFHGRVLHLLRFGWIDFEDWQAQNAQTGQAATLSEEVYRNKLLVIPGEYRARGSVGLLPQVGTKTLARFAAMGIHSVEQLLAYRGNDPELLAFKERAAELFPEVGDQSMRRTEPGG